MTSFKYSGSELETFKFATNFKKYYFKLANNHIPKFNDVLEIGAGIGNQSLVFSRNIDFHSWTCIEPDESNSTLLKSSLGDDPRFNVFTTTLEDFHDESKYDLILLADVLEHLPNDSSSLRQILSLLKPHGILLIYVPACQFLFSSFDSSIGHFRRYSIPTLTNIIPDSFTIVSIGYFDSVGWLLSFLNKVFLKSSSPSKRQILFWDRFVVPLSIIVDKLLGFKFGKNIFCVVRNA